jgi:hypothetical protein
MKEHAGSRDIGFRGVAMAVTRLRASDVTVTGTLKLPEVRA